MEKLLLMTIFFAFAIVVPTPTMAVMPASNVHVVAAADADRPQVNSTARDEKGQNESSEKGKPVKDKKRENESLEKGKSTESRSKSSWKINVLPRPDNMKSPIEKKEDQFHLPPDRF